MIHNRVKTVNESGDSVSTKKLEQIFFIYCPMRKIGIDPLYMGVKIYQITHTWGYFFYDNYCHESRRRVIL